MNRQDLTELLNGLPDEWIESAAEPEHLRKRTSFRLWVGGIAACIAVLIAAAVYPRLRVQEPKRIETTAPTTAVTTETTVTQTLPSSLEKETTAPPPQTETSAAGSAETITGSSAVSSVSSIETTTGQTELTTTVTHTSEYQTEPTTASSDTTRTTSKTTVSRETTHTESTAHTHAEGSEQTRTEITHTESAENTQAGAKNTSHSPPVNTTAMITDETALDSTYPATYTEVTGITGVTTGVIGITDTFVEPLIYPQCWRGDISRPEGTAPEHSQFGISVHATVYTEAVPDMMDKLGFQPEIDMSKYDALELCVNTEHPDVWLVSGTLASDGQLSFHLACRPAARPLTSGKQYFLIAIPKQYHIQAEMVFTNPYVPATDETYMNLRNFPFVILDMSGEPS